MKIEIGTCEHSPQIQFYNNHESCQEEQLNLDDLFDEPNLEEEDDECDNDENTEERRLVITGGREEKEPPSYLMSAILAGLYELPPDHILRYQTGWGRRIRYDLDNTHGVVPSNDFSFVEKIIIDGANNNNTTTTKTSLTLERKTLSRYFFGDKNTNNECTERNHLHRKAESVADFDIYRIRVQDGDSQQFNAEVRGVALEEEKQYPNGLDVSNAGGSWHGRPNFFKSLSSSPSSSASSSCDAIHNRTIREKLFRICKEGIRAIHRLHGNHDDYDDDDDLNLDPSNIECWINISRDGSWNRLHTHEGSAWSGVYYVDAPPPQGDCFYSGMLTLKPTPHPKEDTYELRSEEQQRFYNTRAPDSNDPAACMDACRYLALEPVAGHMIVFPSWLHHCVLPSKTTNERQPRISIAFNINWKKKRQA